MKHSLLVAFSLATSLRSWQRDGNPTPTGKGEGPGVALANRGEATRTLEVFVRYYNTQRLQGRVDCLTPDKYHRGLGLSLIVQHKEVLRAARERRLQLSRQRLDRGLRLSSAEVLAEVQPIGSCHA